MGRGAKYPGFIRCMSQWYARHPLATTGRVDCYNSNWGGTFFSSFRSSDLSQSI
jgi:hypothetical protein